MQPRLKTQYKEVVLPQLQKDFSYGNVMMVPKLEKIAVSYTHLTLPTRRFV